MVRFGRIRKISVRLVAIKVRSGLAKENCG